MLILPLLTLGLLAPVQEPEPTTPTDTGGPESITAGEIRAHVEFLAADELTGRRAGTPGGHAAAQYIAKQFASSGLSAIDASGNYLQPFKAGEEKTENVVGFLEGAHPELKHELIVIGAHYDHLGQNAETGAIYNGADDDASGTAVMLEVAEAFGHAQMRPKRSLIFIAFGAEELGLIGSRHYVKSPLRPLEKTRWMVNLEMMGRGDEGQVTVMMFGELPDALQDSVGEHAWNQELQVVDGGKAHLGSGDQFPFHDAKIPILCFYGGDNHPDYHQPTDTAEKIQPAWMQAVARTVYASVETLANLAP